MKIFFLSNQNSCRSQMAEAILRSYNKNIEIYSAGIKPTDHVSPIAIEVMAEIGISLKPQVPQHYSKFDDMEFDYLITVGDGTVEQLQVPPIKCKRKMHLGFHNPYQCSNDKEEIKQKCREIRDEIKTEMDYFYYRILKKQIDKSA
ncbi:arsenate reductase [Mariniphaga anaerophila]|uniref:Arsenate reductase n=1 Tax=Mariniphaga anaerophila TaxID=1484053 RepID=A0A1M5E713_9BACT|nr:arsenate reductase ArsC [Mariniphaga anaerophila]SHF74841.1 arsenate reductase [Mariniphaga anaerophila]